MKKLVTISLLLFSFFISNIYSQTDDKAEAPDLIGSLGNRNPQANGINTTMIEYNYITKGYKIQIESGLDMKKGYSFKNLQKINLYREGINRIVSYQQLFRNGDAIPCATMIKFKRMDTEYESYLCIPSPNANLEIWNKAKKNFEANANDWTPASKDYAWGLFKVISVLSSKETNCNTNISNANINVEIGGGLTGRKLIVQPDVKGEFVRSGKVNFKVCIDSKGNVLDAEYTQNGSNSGDSNLIRFAKSNALDFKFESSSIGKQCGTITYTYRLN